MSTTMPERARHDRILAAVAERAVEARLRRESWEASSSLDTAPTTRGTAADVQFAGHRTGQRR